MKKFNKPTVAEKVFKNSPILNERPKGMSHEEYKALRKLQTRAIQYLFPGPVNETIARNMRPKQKSLHHLKMVNNARGIKYGYLKDIEKEAEENQKLAESKQSGWFIEYVNKIREVFGGNSGK